MHEYTGTGNGEHAARFFFQRIRETPADDAASRSNPNFSDFAAAAAIHNTHANLYTYKHMSHMFSRMREKTDDACARFSSLHLSRKKPR